MLSGQWSTANAQGAIATNNNRVIVPITSGRNIPYVAFTGNIRLLYLYTNCIKSSLYEKACILLAATALLP